MRKHGRAIIFVIILVVCVVLYLALSGEQANNTRSQKTEVAQTDVSLQKPEIEESQPASEENVTVSPLQPPDSETLRQEAEQRFEKLTRIEETSGTLVERGEGLRVQIEIPILSEPAQTE